MPTGDLPPGQRNRVNTAPAPSKRLLIVDDERIQRMLIVRIVTPLDYAVDCAADLAEATAYLRQHRYDAIILDLSLGDTEGISLLSVIRACGGEPVLLFLSHLDDRVLAASLRLASTMGLLVAGTLRKPAPPCELRALLQNPPRRAAAAGDHARHPPSVSELAEAIRSGQILPHFQPKISLRDRRVVGVEALARWPGYTKELMPPDTFVPMAERVGLVVPLTFQIMRASLEACGRWRVLHPDCSVAVNISPLVLVDPTLPDEIDRLLAETGLGPGALVAEITESTVIANPIMAAEILTRLRIKGIELSIDDFGTGHSSLLALLRLPFSELKIDRSFVSNCETDPEAWKIVRATISMARELGLRVVAEGIETGPVADLLRNAGCDVGQGWYFGRAMPEAALTEFLTTFDMAPA